MSKKKVVMILLALTMSAVMMVGCGHGNDTDASAASADYEVSTDLAVPDDSDSATVTPELYTDENGEVVTQAPNDGSIGESDNTNDREDIAFGHVPEDETVPWDEMESENEDVTEEVPMDTGEIEGIVVLEADWRSNSAAPTFIVSTINSDTGDYHTISSFVFEHVARIQEDEFLIEPAYELSRYSNYRDMFNEDFTLMAATKTFLANEEKHAGWVDQSGEFFDLTVALNEQAQSDFDAAKHYKSVGFTTDGNFVYADVEDPHNPIYYMVPLNKVGPGASSRVDGGHSYIMDIHSDAWDWTRGYFVSSWINEGQFLATGAVDGNVTCWCANVAAKSINQIVPTGSQTSWGPVIGPDGTSVAFLSAPNQGTDNPSIYITDVKGEGNPVKLETSYSPLSGRYAEHGDILRVISIGYHYASVLEWR